MVLKLPGRGERRFFPDFLVRSTEGRILLLGIAVTLAGLIAMGAASFSAPEAARMAGIMSFANIVMGRAVSMSIGYAGGHDPVLVLLVNLWAETALVLLFYPLFVLSMRKLLALRRLQGYFERTRAAAERHRHRVHRYGIIGLFVFVWFPFWMTGPVVGAAIGYLLGFRAWLTLSIVLASTYIAMLAWAYVLFGVYISAAGLGPWAPALIAGLLILIVLASYWLNRRRNHGAAGSQAFEPGGQEKTPVDDGSHRPVPRREDQAH